jgi:hypothetical protein
MQILSVIKSEAPNGLLVWKHPAEDFNTLSTLIVNESQVALLYKNGQIADNFKAEFLKNDEPISTPSEQAVNALYSAVKFAALAAEENCTSQDMVDQIEEGLTEVGQEDAAASTVGEKLAVGSKWLFKMLGAFTKLQGEDKIQSIENLTKNTEAGVAEAGSLQATATWLYSCVFACGVLTGEMTVD